MPALIIFIVIFSFQDKNNNFNFIELNDLKISASTGFLSPSAYENIDASATPWIDLIEGISQNDDYTMALSIPLYKYSDTYRTTNFGFSLPDCTIDGIIVEIDKYSSVFIEDISVKLVIFGNPIGDDKAKIGIEWDWSDTDTYTSYGGITDIWNSGLSYTNVNDATFGVQIKARNSGPFGSQSAFIDHIRIKIYYSIDEEEENPPTFDTITESADPLELGATETISVNVYDESTISNVYIEINGVNYSMSFISGDTYRYSEWTPTSIGIKTYQIHMIDEYGNINQTNDLNITVIDTTNPIISNVIESADPLELGDTEIIECDITDYSPMEFVYIEINGVNYSMSFVSGIKWRYNNWTPTSLGVKNYTIWANDTSGNLDFYSNNITVIEPTEIVIDSIYVLLLLMLIMLVIFFKMNEFLLILITFLFSLIIGFNSLMIGTMAFSPYFQIFFLMFQSVIFYISAIGEYNYKKNKKRGLN